MRHSFLNNALVSSIFYRKNNIYPGKIIFAVSTVLFHVTSFF